MKRIIVLVVIIATILLIKGVSAQYIDDVCPKGTYDIGVKKDKGPICRLEPTGCAYGDSIPIDDIKCAPTEEASAPISQQDADFIVEALLGK